MTQLLFFYNLLVTTRKGGIWALLVSVGNAQRWQLSYKALGSNDLISIIIFWTTNFIIQFKSWNQLITNQIQMQPPPPPPPFFSQPKKKKICRIMLTIGAYMRVKTPFLSSFIFTSLSPHTMCSRYLVDQNDQNIYKFMQSKEKSYAHVKSSFRDLRFEFKGLQWVQSENRSWRSGKENYLPVQHLLLCCSRSNYECLQCIMFS